MKPLSPGLVAGLAVLVLAGADDSLASRTSSAADTRPLARFLFKGSPEFGTSVALSRSGTTAVVGDPSAARATTAFKYQDTVRIFTRGRLDENWRDTKLSIGKDVTGFGTSVAVSADGKIVVVGAPYSNRRKAGTAWIYRKVGGGTWVGQKLRPNDESGNSTFGYSVALSSNGSVALVGGFADNKQKGAAWVFARSGTSWRQQGKKITPKGEQGAGEFGKSVALSADGQMAMIGAPRDDSRLGAAWFFARTNGKWTQQGSKLKTPSYYGRKPFFFGWDVALSANGRIALIGSPGLTTSGFEVTGAAFFFTRSGSDWKRRPLVTGGSMSLTGRKVALSPSGNAAAIGGSPRSGTNARYYSCSTLGCLSGPLSLTIEREEKPTEGFGSDVAVTDDGDTILVGSLPGQAWGFVKWPLVKDVVPGVGPVAGGTEVTITGENFVKVREVAFGSTAASYTVESPTQIRAVAPPGTGSVHVRVTTDVGISPVVESSGWGSSTDDRFAYVERPVVTSISPTSGPTAGGTVVTIGGSNLLGASAVRFGGVVATNLNPNAAGTSMTVTSPPHVAGAVDVTVTTAGDVCDERGRPVYLRGSGVGEADHVRRPRYRWSGGRGRAADQGQLAVRGPRRDLQRRIGDRLLEGGSSYNGFAHSGTIGIEQCVGVEFCSTPIRATFSSAQKLVRVWIGFSFPLNQSLPVELKAYAGNSVVGTADATLPANSAVTPIRTSLEVQVGSASITKVEVSVPGGYTSAVAVDDLTFQS